MAEWLNAHDMRRSLRPCFLYIAACLLIVLVIAGKRRRPRHQEEEPERLEEICAASWPGEQQARSWLRRPWRNAAGTEQRLDMLSTRLDAFDESQDISGCTGSPPPWTKTDPER